MNIIEFASKKGLLEKLTADAVSRGDLKAVNDHVGLIADVILRAQADIWDPVKTPRISLDERDRRVLDLRKAAMSIGRRIVKTAYHNRA